MTKLDLAPEKIDGYAIRRLEIAAVIGNGLSGNDVFEINFCGELVLSGGYFLYYLLVLFVQRVLLGPAK